MPETGRRIILRRNDDRDFRERTRRFKKLYNIGQTITNEIRIKKDSGLAGWVFQNKKTGHRE